MSALLLKTDNLGFAAVPLIFLRIRYFIFAFVETLCSLFIIYNFRFCRKLIFTNYYLPAALPAFLLNTSSVYLTPFPLYGSGLRKLLNLAAT